MKGGSNGGGFTPEYKVVTPFPNMPAAKGNISGEGVTAERCRAEELVEVGAAGGGAHIDTSSIPESPTNSQRNRMWDAVSSQREQTSQVASGTIFFLWRLARL